MIHGNYSDWPLAYKSLGVEASISKRTTAMQKVVTKSDNGMEDLVFNLVPDPLVNLRPCTGVVRIERRLSHRWSV